ncbi:putative spermidine/putrescine transport system permease protein [Palleronia aestuarii]|uniref:Putative spermidine/putrescine transport system permease protein n=1 Tax=Palleronia aestuarii TaxID=568105 RepID=A0A2W7P366_9RHOB|nr:ABC transporter permease [Palleronia aestuarii]PZX19866.1 putative spermidine/putrescine transport system permease protein [Palleronia aestuarii]
MSDAGAGGRADRPSTLFSASTLIGPATLLVAIGILAPMLFLARYSLNLYDPRLLMIEAFSPANYIAFFSDPFYLGVFFTTLRVSFVCTAVCIVLGFPLAYLLARTGSRMKNLMIIGIVIPLFVGNAVRAAGWMTFFGSRGLLSVTLMDLGLRDGPTEIMFTETAVIIGIIAVNLPYMVLTLQSVLEGIDRNLEEAAFSLGAPPWTMFRRVLWPLALPGIAAGTILCFILAMNAYATPVLLGGPQFRMMAPMVYNQFQLNNWPLAAALAFILMATTLGLTVVAGLMTRQSFRG